MLCRNLLEIWKQIDAVKFLFSPNMCNGSAQIQARGGEGMLIFRPCEACSNSDSVGYAQTQWRNAQIQNLWGILKFRLSGACSDTVEEFSNSEPVGHTQIQTQRRNAQIQTLWGHAQIQTQWGMLRHSGGMLKFRHSGGMLKSKTCGVCLNSDPVRHAQIQTLRGMLKFRDPVG